MMESPAAIAGLRTPTHYFPQLESLRGWAILLVICFHFLGVIDGQSSTNGLPVDASFWSRLIGAGNTGVTLFFVLSGFLLVQPFLRALHGERRVSILRFYSARLLRIVPLYYAAVLVAWLVSANSSSALKALLFIPVGFDMFPFSVPWWSLSTEMQFYLLLPWLMLTLVWKTGRVFMLLGGIAWVALHCIYLLHPEWLGLPGKPWLENTVFGRGLAFLVGGLAAWFYMNRGHALLASAPRVITLITLLLLGALLWLLQWYGLMGQRAAMQAMPLYHDLEAILWAGLLLCCLAPPGRLRAVFINPIFNHFGTISYSLYLVHVPIQFYLIYPAKVAAGGVATWSDPRIWSAVVGSFLLSWLLAVVCYRLIEQPFLKLKAHLPVFNDDKLRAVPAKG